LQKKLENQEIMMNEKKNWAGMIKILENEMVKETQTKKIGKFKKSIVWKNAK
jgi:hypothetical protein